jgi:hypothetical protein
MPSINKGAATGAMDLDRIQEGSVKLPTPLSTRVGVVIFSSSFMCVLLLLLLLK